MPYLFKIYTQKFREAGNILAQIYVSEYFPHTPKITKDTEKFYKEYDFAQDENEFFQFLLTDTEQNRAFFETIFSCSDQDKKILYRKILSTFSKAKDVISEYKNLFNSLFNKNLLGSSKLTEIEQEFLDKQIPGATAQKTTPRYDDPNHQNTYDYLMEQLEKHKKNSEQRNAANDDDNDDDNTESLNMKFTKT